MRVHLVAVSLIATLGAFACASARRSESAPSAAWIGTVSVRVELADGSVPVTATRAVLRCPCLDHELDIHATTEGVVRFSDLPPGQYELSLRAGEGGRDIRFELERGNMEFWTRESLDPNDPVLTTTDVVFLSEIRSHVCATTVHVPSTLSGGPMMECRCAPETFWTVGWLGRSMFDGGGRELFEGGPRFSLRLP